MTGTAGPRCRDTVAVAVILFVVGSGLAALAHGSSPPGVSSGVSATARPPVTGATYVWTNLSALSSTAPSPRSSPQAAYSPALGKVVLFGGYDVSVTPDGDTWEFASGHWTEVSSAVAPPARWSGEMVYDASDGYLLLFGGKNDTQGFNDTWAFSATGWHQIATPIAPSPRSNPGLVFDPSDGKVVLFGGGIGNLPVGSGSPWTYYNDTWTYHAGVWTNVTATAGAPPSPRFTQTMSYDALDGYVILQGGGSSTAPACGIFNDTWKFSGGKWTPLSPPHSPPPFWVGGMTLDTETNSTLLYGGMAVPPPSCVDTFASQVWTFSSGDWSLAVPPTNSSPQGRSAAAWVDDPAENGELLFGGDGAGPGYNYLDDSWLLTSVSPLALGPLVSSSRPSADVGQTTSFRAGGVSGGQPPYTYLWEGLPTGCLGTSSAVVNCTFTSAAHLEISLVVSDPVGQTNSSAVLAYEVFADPVFASYPTPNHDPVSVGDPVTFSANVTGGSGGFTFAWRGLPPGCASIDAPSLTCTPTQNGTFSVSLVMNDSNGVTATSPSWPEVVLPVSAPSSPESPVSSWYTSTYFLIGMIVILVAVVLAVGSWLRRKPPATMLPAHSTPPPASPPAS